MSTEHTDGHTFDRRRFFQVGGLAAAAAGLAACINGKGSGTAASTTTSTTLATKGDVTTLRTASSIEALLVQAYQKILDANLVTTPALLDTIKLFQTQHKAHLTFFESATKRGGGKAYGDPNPALAASISQQVAGLGSEREAIQLVYSLEKQAAATYQADIGSLDDPLLHEAVMSVGGAEARHVAVLAQSVGQPPVAGAFASTDGAVAAGTGGI
jgi:hypothetical protein